MHRDIFGNDLRLTDSFGTPRQGSCSICHEEIKAGTCPNANTEWHKVAVEEHERYLKNPLPANFKLNLPVDDAVHKPDSN